MKLEIYALTIRVMTIVALDSSYIPVGTVEICIALNITPDPPVHPVKEVGVVPVYETA